ncbi:MAG: diaminopimelate epimerase [Fuerstiella sp.]|nr:diaminopimelate epimerase [Fuerstiella sp.]MCP4859369.1 diaminopimelate epimerase [Fuerstiella sp.]
MSDIAFIKMHGAGNDYVFIDGFATQVPQFPEQLARSVSDRNFGIGSDGLIVMSPADHADVEMQMWNSDGSEGAMCGNGARCVALWMSLQNRVSETCQIQAASRVVTATAVELNRSCNSGIFSVDMGQPAVISEQEQLPDVKLPGTDADVAFTSVSLGNPHAVIFVDQLTDRVVRHVGSQIETHSRFPDRTNVEWVQLVSATEIDLRVWERGSGETLACGTGACAAVVAAVQRSFCTADEEISVNLPGGRLHVRIDEFGHIWLTGPAKVSFSGFLNTVE